MKKIELKEPTVEEHGNKVLLYRIMIKFNKSWRNALYLVLPLCFFAVIHLIFSYVIWDLNPDNWSIDARFWSALLGTVAMVIGGFIAHDTCSKEQKY